MDRLDITLGDSPNGGIWKILRKIRPSWDQDEMFIKNLKGGHLNRLFACGLKVDALEKDVVVVRVFESGADDIVDREKEILAMRIGSNEGLAAPIYCRFNNGIALKFARGCPVDFSNQHDEIITRAIGRNLAKLHLIDYKKVLKDIGEGDKVKQFTSCFCYSKFLPDTLAAVPERYEHPEKETIRKEEFMTKTEVTSEIGKLDEQLKSMNFPLVFSHNDLNTGNIVFDKQAKDVNFLDWEVADVSYAVNDIGIFFLAHAYNSTIKCHPDQYKLYPSKDYQTKWIRWYLESKAELSDENPKGVSEDEIQRLYVGANLEAMIFALFVVQWVLTQDASSSIELDFFATARHLQGLFYVIKTNLDKGL